MHVLQVIARPMSFCLPHSTSFVCAQIRARLEKELSSAHQRREELERDLRELQQSFQQQQQAARMETDKLKQTFSDLEQEKQTIIDMLQQVRTLRHSTLLLHALTIASACCSPYAAFELHAG